MGIFETFFGSPSKSKSVQNPDQVYQAQAPYLQSLWGSGQTLANQQMAPGSQFQQQLGQQQGAWQDLLSGSQNPYLQGMASNAMGAISRQFNEQIMPSLLGGGNAAGQLGGERYGLQQTQAAEAAARAMSAAGADVYGRAWESGLQGQQAALQMSPQVMGSAWQPLLAQKDLVGAPTVLGQGGTSTSTGASKGILGTLAEFGGKAAGGGSWFGG